MDEKYVVSLEVYGPNTETVYFEYFGGLSKSNLEKLRQFMSEIRKDSEISKSSAPT